MRPASRVSVVIPCYFSARTLGRCLEALRRQTFSAFETIVINSSPDEATRGLVVEGFPDVRFEQSRSRLLPHAARNRGAALASAAFLVFTDPDCEASPRWLEYLVAAHDAGHQVVGGSILPGSGRWFETGAHLCKFSWLMPGLPPGSRWILPSANVGYSRRLWERIGPLDPSRFCADALLSWKAAAAGHPPWFEPRAVVRHHHDGSLRAFWRERTERGREFGAMRLEHEQWSRLKAMAMVTLMPALVPLVAARAGHDAAVTGWLARFVSTLPVQLAGQLGWCAGEARACWQYAATGRIPASRSAA